MAWRSAAEHRAWVAARRAAGLCVECGATATRRTCEPCASRRRAARAAPVRECARCLRWSRGRSKLCRSCVLAVHVRPRIRRRISREEADTWEM